MFTSLNPTSSDKSLFKKIPQQFLYRLNPTSSDKSRKTLQLSPVSSPRLNPTSSDKSPSYYFHKIIISKV